jgi:hypothetical protein
MDQKDALVHNRSSPEAKIALFHSLFRGRGDVYPRRFVSRKTGKSGYQPACANQWISGLCEKPRIKCAECLHSLFLPVTDRVTEWHLTGQDDDGRDFVMEVYPMLQDETCFSLALIYYLNKFVQQFLEILITEMKKQDVYSHEICYNAISGNEY